MSCLSPSFLFRMSLWMGADYRNIDPYSRDVDVNLLMNVVKEMVNK